MKTKILLSITMLALIFNTYANDKVSMDSIRYAIQHPGTPIVVATVPCSMYSSDWLWETEYTVNQMVTYEDGNFSAPFNQTIMSPTTFCWWIMIYFIIGLIGSFSMWWSGYVVGLPLLALFHIIFDNEHVHWWIPVIVLIFFICAGVFGYYVKKFKTKKT